MLDESDPFLLSAESSHGDGLMNVKVSDFRSGNKRQNEKASGKKRRPTGKKPPAIDNLFGSDFDFSDSDDGNGPKKSGGQMSRAPDQKKSGADLHDPSRKVDGPIGRLEDSLTKYLSRAIDGARMDFLHELQFLVEDTREQESQVNAFVYDLTGAMEETVDSELALARASGESSQLSSTLHNIVNDQMTALMCVVPRNRSKEKANKLSSLTVQAGTSSSKMEARFNEIMEEFMNERASARMVRDGHGPYLEARRRVESVKAAQLEIEANTKRLDIEEQLLQRRQDVFDALKRDWAEQRVDAAVSIDVEARASPCVTVLDKIRALSNTAPRSKLKSAVSGLVTLADTAHKSLAEMEAVRGQLELAMTKIRSAVSRRTVPPPTGKHKEGGRRSSRHQS